MLQDMFGGKIKADFLDGLQRFGKEYNEPSSNVQIRITFGATEDKPLAYEVCIGFKPKKEVSYKQIMDIKMDLLGQEQMVGGVILQSLFKQCESLTIEPQNASAFLMDVKGQVIVAVYDGFKHKKVCTVEELLS